MLRTAGIIITILLIISMPSQNFPPGSQNPFLHINQIILSSGEG